MEVDWTRPVLVGTIDRLEHAAVEVATWAIEMNAKWRPAGHVLVMAQSEETVAAIALPPAFGGEISGGEVEALLEEQEEKGGA